MHPVDNHTLYELQIIAEHNREASILNFFDQTKTQRGRDFLKAMIGKPKANLDDLKSFQKLIQAIVANPASWEINISRSYVFAVENYYELNVAHTMSQDAFIHWIDTLLFSYRNPAEFHRIQSGLIATLKFMRALQEMVNAVSETNVPKEIEEDVLFIKNFFGSMVVKSFLKQKDNALSTRFIFYLDYHFRVLHKKQLRRFLDIFYYLDALGSIAKTAKLHQLTFPVFNQNSQSINANFIWNPLVHNAIPNSIIIDDQNPVCILTGANTSGKTTFLKTLGITVYLAHLGWPVPASALHLPFLDRIFTSIHLSDNLALGYSHFYNEMMRIRQIAEALNENQHCLVIIDELFRGTNQEDALHCSKTVLNGFSNYTGSYFLISTHLLDLVESFKNTPLFTFNCFRTRINGPDFESSYQMEPGIATEKIGRLIMDKTGITPLLERQIKRSSNN